MTIYLSSPQDQFNLHAYIIFFSSRDKLLLTLWLVVTCLSPVFTHIHKGCEGDQGPPHNGGENCASMLILFITVTH